MEQKIKENLLSHAEGQSTQHCCLHNNKESWKHRGVTSWRCLGLGHLDSSKLALFRWVLPAQKPIGGIISLKTGVAYSCTLVTTVTTGKFCKAAGWGQGQFLFFAGACLLALQIKTSLQIVRKKTFQIWVSSIASQSVWLLCVHVRCRCMAFSHGFMWMCSLGSSPKTPKSTSQRQQARETVFAPVFEKC